MKKSLISVKMINLFIRTLSFLMCITFAGLAQSADIIFDVGTQDVAVGSDFSLTVQGTDVPVIVTGGLNLIFNPAVLKIKSVNINTSVFESNRGDGAEEGILNNASGSLTDTTFRTLTGVSGDFTIMTIDFTAVGNGTSLLRLSESTVSVFLDSMGKPVGNQIVFGEAVINVSADHVPAVFWLLSAGLLILGGLVQFSLSSKQTI